MQTFTSTHAATNQADINSVISELDRPVAAVGALADALDAVTDREALDELTVMFLTEKLKEEASQLVTMYFHVRQKLRLSMTLIAEEQRLPRPSAREAAAARGLDYGAYIHSDAWRELRARVLERDGYECRACCGTEVLIVHHRHYETLGAEHPDDLLTLCASCHHGVSKAIERRRRGFKLSATRRDEAPQAERDSRADTREERSPVGDQP